MIPGFDVVAALSYTDVVVTQGAPAVPATPTNSGTPSTTGTQLLGAPKWIGSTFLSYDLGKAEVAGPLGGLTIGAGVRYVDGSFGSTTYSVINGVTTYQLFKTKSFTLVDALIGYDLGHASPSLEGFSVAVNAANLFDKRYVSACPFSNSCYFGSARTVVGSLRYAW